jgi:membrane-bound serine protease (ClpP class)
MSLAFVSLIFIIGVVLIILELFIPGGVAGVIGTLLVLTGIGGAYIEHGIIPGTIMLGVSLGVAFAFFHLALRQFTLENTQSREAGYVAVAAGLDELLGKTGSVVTQLRPVGTARIEDDPVDVVTRGEMIEPGTLIEVIRVEGNRVVVRARQT